MCNLYYARANRGLAHNIHIIKCAFNKFKKHQQHLRSTELQDRQQQQQQHRGSTKRRRRCAARRQRSSSSSKGGNHQYPHAAAAAAIGPAAKPKQTCLPYVISKTYAACSSYITASNQHPCDVWIHMSLRRVGGTKNPGQDGASTAAAAAARSRKS